MYFGTWEELSKCSPVSEGVWDKEKLVEFLIQTCNRALHEKIDEFFLEYAGNEELADLLFGILLDEDEFDGSDALIGAAYYASRLSKDLLRKRKNLLQKAQENKIYAHRPFKDDAYLSWL